MSSETQRFIVIQKEIGNPPVALEWDDEDVWRLNGSQVERKLIKVPVNGKNLNVSMWVDEQGLLREHRPTNFLLNGGVPIVGKVLVTKFDRRRKAPMHVASLSTDEVAAVMEFFEYGTDDADGEDVTAFLLDIIEFPESWNGPRYCVVTKERNVIFGRMVCHYGWSRTEAILNYRDQLFFGLLDWVEGCKVIGQWVPGEFSELGNILRWSTAYCADPPGTVLWLLKRLVQLKDVDPVIREYVAVANPWRGPMPLRDFEFLNDLYLRGYAAEDITAMSNELRKCARVAGGIAEIRTLVDELDPWSEAQVAALEEAEE